MFAAYTLLAPADDRFFTFFNTWVYDGLMVLACVIAGSHAYLVAKERAAWTVITVALGCWTFGELWYAIFKPETYPSMADSGYIAFYPLLYVGHRSAAALAGAHSIGGTLWLDGATAAWRPRRSAPRSSSSSSLGARRARPRPSSRTSRTRSATSSSSPAVFGVFSLTGWRPGRRWLALGLGVLSTALADSIYLFQSAEGTYVEGTWIDILWPTRAAAHRSRRPGCPTARARPRGRGPPAARRSGGLRARRDRDPRLRPLHPREPARDRARDGDALLVVVRLAVTFRENSRLFELTRQEATTDALTGLGNRRQLLNDLERRLHGDSVPPTLLMLFDLDGFKGYNDTFGHPAGDALLARLGEKLARFPDASGAAYRLGGDEFCLLATVGEGEAEPLIDRACEALTERGEGFEIETSFGAIMLPDEATDASHALQVADERLYAQKYSRRGESDRTMAALLEALSLREPGAAGAARRRRRRWQETSAGRSGSAATSSRSSTARRSSTTSASSPSRTRSSRSPARSTSASGRSSASTRSSASGSCALRRRCAASPPSCARRHENWDGSGYPDGLAGEDIPLASRIIRACNAYVAMTSTRPYREALSVEDALNELMRCAGTDFDPTVVRVLVARVRDEHEAERAA